MLLTALDYSHQLLKEVLEVGDTAIDATMGNGGDTLFMAELVGKTGKVYSFDIQELALQNTTEKLTVAGVEATVELFLTGHENIDSVIPKDVGIKACVFNLGYLPRSDKRVVTLPETTIQAMEAVLARLLPGGRLVIVAYYGHAGGARELESVERFCEGLPQEKFAVMRYEFVNQRNAPPILFCVERR